MTGWALREPALVQIRPDWVAMVFNTALSFVLLGTGLVLADRADGLRRVLGLLVSILAAAVLAEGLAGFDLGVDWRDSHAWLNDGNHWPGRMAPNTALGFLLAGAVLASIGSVKKKVHCVALQVATFIVLLLGLTGLVGYALQLELMYSWFKATRMAVHTAVGMTILGLGLWSNWLRSDWYHDQNVFREDERITFVGAAFLVVIALTTGVAGLAAQQKTLDRILSETLPMSLKSRTALFRAEVEGAIALTRTTGARPGLIRSTRALLEAPDNAGVRAELQRIGQSVLLSGTRGLIVRDLEGRELLRLGKLAANPALETDIGLGTEASLLWDKGYFLRSSMPIVDGSVRLGILVLESPLPLLQKQMGEDSGLGSTGETGLCAAAGPRMRCYPQYRNPRVYTIDRNADHDRPTPMSLAVDGKTGVFRGLDYQGKNVIAAYASVGSTGLGMVVKQDAADLFSPVKAQLQWTVPLLLLLVALGVLFLRAQVRPLAARLIASEERAIEGETRIRAVVEGVGDGIIIINEQGTIESFNAAASDIFGYLPAEAIGENVRRLMPSDQRGSHDAGMRRYLETGEAHVIGRKGIELPGLRKNGSIFPMELSVSDVAVAGTRRFVGVVRDISERKRNDAAVFAERERLRVTLSSIGDGVITTDTLGRVTYLNPVAESMTGWPSAEAMGKHLPVVFNVVDEATNERALNPVEIVLRDTAPAGLAENTTLLQRDGARFAIEDSAAPIRDQAGDVIGVVLVFHDVSQARLMAREMTHQASHDLLTGLINRREFERRLEQAIESGRVETKQHSMLYMDLDQFKIVNDTCGHAAGDELLKRLTAMLLDKLRQSDTLARLGGDEFGVLLEGCPLEPAVRIAETLRQTVHEFHYLCQDKVFPIGVSIGVTTFSNGGITLAEVLRTADAACYAAKDQGRNRVHVYTQADIELAERQGEMGWVGRIQK